MTIPESVDQGTVYGGEALCHVSTDRDDLNNTNDTTVDLKIATNARLGRCE